MYGSGIFRIKRKNGTLTLVLSMALSHLDGDDLIKTVKELNFENVETLEFDFSECAYISSRVIGAFTVIRKFVEEKDIAFTLRNVSDDAREIFRWCNMSELIGE